MSCTVSFERRYSLGVQVLGCVNRRFVESIGSSLSLKKSRSIRDLVRRSNEVCIDWVETREIEGTKERPSLRVSVSVSVRT